MTSQQILYSQRGMGEGAQLFDKSALWPWRKQVLDVSTMAFLETHANGGAMTGQAD